MSDGAARGDGECSEPCTNIPLSDQARVSVCKRMGSWGHGCVPDQVCECWCKGIGRLLDVFFCCDSRLNFWCIWWLDFLKRICGMIAVHCLQCIEKEGWMAEAWLARKHFADAEGKIFMSSSNLSFLLISSKYLHNSFYFGTKILTTFPRFPLYQNWNKLSKILW
jgi:hypothetical protein